MASQPQQRQPPAAQGHPEIRDPRLQPEMIRPDYRAAQKLAGRVVLVTGADGGIGRAVAVHCAHEGARVAVAYFDGHHEARQTARMIEDAGSECLLIAGDLGDQEACRRAVQKVVARFGGLDVLVNNATGQRPADAPDDIDSTAIERTFRSNAFAYLYLMTAALPYLPRGGSIINTSSDSSAHGHRRLIDYAATHGAVQAMTCSFAEAVADRGIRVNAVAAGPIWTPLVPSTFDAGDVDGFGGDTLLKRAGQPSEVAPAYVFLASQDASYITGQTIHINGGGHISA